MQAIFAFTSGILFIHFTSIYPNRCVGKNVCNYYGDELSDYGYILIFIVVGIFAIYFELTRDENPPS